jgi:tetratricopeptide (TPR) repeat protein
VLLVILWWRTGRLDWKRDVRPLVGWLVLGACAGFFTAWVERTFILAQGTEFVLTPLQRILLAGRVVWFYAGKVIWPVNLMFNYPRWTIDPREWWQYLYPAGLVALLAWFAALAHRHRGPLAALLIFGGTLVPVMGFLNVYPFRYSYVTDHFQYLATLAIIVPVSSLLTAEARRMSVPKRGAAVLAGLLVLGLGVLTWRQAHWYSDAETLYRETLQRNPGSFLARVNLCTALLQSPGRLTDAMAPCEDSLRFRPDLPENHLNMGLVWARTSGRMPEAIAEMRAALQLRPSYSAAHLNLGHALALSAQPAEAVAEYQAALDTVPDNPQAYVGIGNTLATLPGRQQDAIAAYEKALQILPCYPDAHYGVGRALLQLPGRAADAIGEFEAAVQCQPDYSPALSALQQLEGR